MKTVIAGVSKSLPMKSFKRDGVTYTIPDQEKLDRETVYIIGKMMRLCAENRDMHYVELTPPIWCSREEAEQKMRTLCSLGYKAKKPGKNGFYAEGRVLFYSAEVDQTDPYNIMVMLSFITDHVKAIYDRYRSSKDFDWEDMFVAISERMRRDD